MTFRVETIDSEYDLVLYSPEPEEIPHLVIDHDSGKTYVVTRRDDEAASTVAKLGNVSLIELGFRNALEVKQVVENHLPSILAHSAEHYRMGIGWTDSDADGEACDLVYDLERAIEDCTEIPYMSVKEYFSDLSDSEIAENYELKSGLRASDIWEKVQEIAEECCLNKCHYLSRSDLYDRILVICENL